MHIRKGLISFSPASVIMGVLFPSHILLSSVWDLHVSWFQQSFLQSSLFLLLGCLLGASISRWMRSKRGQRSSHSSLPGDCASNCREIELALRQSETRLQAAQRVAQVGIWELDLTTQQVIYSTELQQIMGWASSPQPPYINYSDYLQYIHPDDRVTVQTAIDHAIQTKSSYTIDFRVLHPDGTVRHVEGHGEAVYDELRQPMRMLGVMVDITDRKRIELELQQQAERERTLRVITQHIRQSLNLDEILATTVNEVQHTLQADQVLIYRFPSPCVAQLIQVAHLPSYPIDPTLFQAQVDFPEVCYSYYQTGVPHVITGEAQHECEIWIAQYMQKVGVKTKVAAPIIQQQEGTTEVWGLLIAQACSNYRVWQPQEAEFLQQIANQLAIVIQQAKLYQQLKQLNTGLEQKVHQRTVQLERGLIFEALLKRITDKVRDSLDESQILQTAVRELAIGLGTCSCDTGLYDIEQGISTIAYEYVADGISTMLGKEIPMDDFPAIYKQLLQGNSLQLCSLPWSSYCVRDPDDHLTALACPMIDNGKVIGDMWLYKSNYIFEEAEIRLVKQVANQCSIALRQSRLYQAAQTQVIELERLNQLKDDFLSTVSHELRTPISNVKMATQLLEIQLKDLHILTNPATPAGRYFQILKEECQHEIRLIDDLLDLTRLDANQNPLLLTEIQLQTFIPHVAEPFIEQAHNQQQELLLDLDASLPFITTDVLYLERILSELFNNACKYTPAGGVISITVQAAENLPDRPDAYLMVKVSNTGIEIPETEYDHIFDKFYRIPNNDPWKHGGTGLGLALVKKLTVQLGATIQVASLPNQTIFTLCLPLVCPTDGSAK